MGGVFDSGSRSPQAAQSVPVCSIGMGCIAMFERAQA